MYFCPLCQCIACIGEPKIEHNVPDAISQVSDKWELKLLSIYTVVLP